MDKLGYQKTIKNFKSLENTNYSYIKNLKQSLNDKTEKIFQLKQQLKEEIYEKKLAQDALLEEGHVLNAIMEISPNSIVIIDIEGIIQFQNHSIGKIHKSEAIGKLIYDFIDSKERYKFKSAVSDILRDGKRKKIVVTFSDPPEFVRTYEIYCGPLKIDWNNIGLILIFSDITDRVLLGKFLQHSE